MPLPCIVWCCCVAVAVCYTPKFELLNKRMSKHQLNQYSLCVIFLQVYVLFIHIYICIDTLLFIYRYYLSIEHRALRTLCFALMLLQFLLLFENCWNKISVSMFECFFVVSAVFIVVILIFVFVCCYVLYDTVESVSHYLLNRDSLKASAVLITSTYACNSKRLAVTFKLWFSMANLNADCTSSVPCSNIAPAKYRRKTKKMNKIYDMNIHIIIQNQQKKKSYKKRIKCCCFFFIFSTKACFLHIKDARNIKMCIIHV